MRKLSEARVTKLLRELEKRKPVSIETDDVKRQAMVQELREAGPARAKRSTR